MQRLGGMIPIYNIRDLEQRRSEIAAILQNFEGKALSDQMEKNVIDQTFRLFMISGSAWVRGLDNRELSGKVSSFLWLYNEWGDSPVFRRTLFMCAMQLLHLSFQAIDVTNTPPYIIQSTPVIVPNNPARINMAAQQPGGNDNANQPEQTRKKHETL